MGKCRKPLSSYITNIRKVKDIWKDSTYLKIDISEFEYYIINDKIEPKKEKMNIRFLKNNNPYKEKNHLLIYFLS